MDAKLDFFKSKKGKDDFLFVEGLGKPEVVTENSKDGGVQTYLQGLALPNGLTSRNGVTYKTESVEKAHGSMKGASMLFNHDPENVVGHVVETWMTSEGMMYKADINPEAKLSNGVNLLESVKRGDLSKVSIRASIDREESFENDQGVVEAFVKEFLELSFVSIPGFKDTSISFESVGKGDFIMDNNEEDNKENKKANSAESEGAVVVKEDLVSLVERVNALESEIGALKESFEKDGSDSDDDEEMSKKKKNAEAGKDKPVNDSNDDESDKEDSDYDNEDDDDDSDEAKKKKSSEADKDKEKPKDDEEDDDESEDLGEVEAAARQQSVNKTINEKTNTDDEKKPVDVKELFSAWTKGFK